MHFKKIKERLSDDTGQSTVEFAIVLFALLLIIVALSLIWKSSSQGLFVEHSVSSASHNVENSSIGVITDVFCY